MSAPAAISATTSSVSEDPVNSSTSMNWEPIRKQLLGADLSVALLATNELREQRMDIVHTTEFPSMLCSLLPAFVSVLMHGTRPNPDVTSKEHLLRNSVLELLSRLPNNEVLRPHAQSLLAIAMDILMKDYEDNAFLASRIVFDLHKNYRPLHQDQVQPFLDFVQNVYRSLPTAVHRNFQPPPLVEAVPTASTQPTPETTPAKDTPPKPDDEDESSLLKTPPSSSPSSSSNPVVRLALKSTSSFRVLTECPLTVMLLFQLYPKFLKTNIPPLINLMVEALALRPPPPTSVKNKQSDRLYCLRSQQLLAAQSKTLSFLTYLLRGFADQMKAYQDKIASHVVALMKCCPRDLITIRKELLVSTRHVLATDFRKGFFRHVDALLDERILFGASMSSSKNAALHHPPSIRPFAYSALADFCHFARGLFNVHQLSRVVHMFSSVLHDGTMNISIQINATRLLLNLPDVVFHNKHPNPQLGRDILVRILHTLVDKLGMLQHYYCDGDTETETTSDGTAEKRTTESQENGATDAKEEKAEKKDEETATQQQGEQAEKQMTDKKQEETVEMDVDSPASKTKDDGDEEKEQQETADESDATARTGPQQTDQPLVSVWKDILTNQNAEGSSDTSCPSRRDVQSIVKYIVAGLKRVMWFITNYRHQREQLLKEQQSSSGNSNNATTTSPPAPATNNDEVSTAMQKMTHWERELVDKYISYALPCLKVFKENKDETKTPESWRLSRNTEEQYREVLAVFASAFAVLDGYNLKRTIGKRLELLFDAIVDDPNVMVLPRHLLASNAQISFEFCQVLLAFLVDRMDDLAATNNKNDSEKYVFVKRASLSDNLNKMHEDAMKQLQAAETEATKDLAKRRATAVLHLFERVLKTLSAYPDNEAALRPYLQKIVASCLGNAMHHPQEWPGNYCSLLIIVFRSISAGKFEESYKELLPLIPTVLNGLYRIYCATPDVPLRHAILELCLTIPARLSSLLPHMSLLLRIIVPALQSQRGELVNLGLRTLEFWVDNLNPEFLYPILSKQTDILTELMMALTYHLRPAPYPYGLLTLRLLGKLGGKNRRFLREPLDLDPYDKRSDDALTFECAWSPSKINYIGKPLEEALEQGVRADKPSSEKEDKDDEKEWGGQVSKSVGDGVDTDAHGVRRPDGDEEDIFHLPLPLDRAVEVLRLVSMSLDLSRASSTESGEYHSGSLEKISWNELRKLWSAKMEDVDFTFYCTNVMEETTRHQAEAAMSVVRCALAAIMDIGDCNLGGIVLDSTEEEKDSDNSEEKNRFAEISHEDATHHENAASLSMTSRFAEARDSSLVLIGTGLLYSSTLSFTRDEAWILLRGLATHVLLIVTSLRRHILRIDANGSLIPTEETHASEKQEDSQAASSVDIAGVAEQKGDEPEKKQSEKKEDVAGSDANKPKRKVTSLKPFGYFKWTGPFQGKANLFTLNHSIAEFLCVHTGVTKQIALDLIGHLLSLGRSLRVRHSDANLQSETNSIEQQEDGIDLFFENLLSQLCEKCLSKPWNMRNGAYEGICMLVDGLGSSWARRYEMELMQVSITAVKIAPREVAASAVSSFRFFSRICLALYGYPESWASSSDKLVHDVLSRAGKKTDAVLKKKLTEKDDATKVDPGGASTEPHGDKEAGEKQDDPAGRGSEEKQSTEDAETGDQRNFKDTDEKDTVTSEDDTETKSDKEKSATSGASSTRERDSVTEESRSTTDKDTKLKPQDAVVKLLLGELASPKHILRFAVRFALQHFVLGGPSLVNNVENVFSRHSSTVKRVLFSRSLRILPLPEQVGVVEGLAFLVECVPGLIPVSDQHLLAFLSELLKMSSIADGEISDSNLVGSAVDKNGYATASNQNAPSPSKKLTSLSHAVGVFLRKECIMDIESGGVYVILPEELPQGIHLRVSSLKLFRGVTRHHADEFFDADAATPIGNIRPHVVSLLFRSLVSNPPQAVVAAHEALRDVLSLSILTRDGPEGGKAQSRLPKELLQTCIRPVLLNLRDHTRLTVPLLNGLSRLLSLLSTWFNKTLGEKLLDHLQKWTDPDRIISRQIWKKGEEPAVAAAILDLFALLPHASHFVEPLVKTTIKLEHALPRFKPRHVCSVYRGPLARYLNKHCQYTVGFFFPRLRNPIYSELFQDVVSRKDTYALRSYLSGRQCSVTLLNVCFERPLAIIRSEKAPSSSSTPPTPPKTAGEILSMHGISPDHSSRSKTQEETIAMRQDIEARQKKVTILHQEAVRAKETLQARIGNTVSGSSSESQGPVEEAQRQCQLAQTAYERAQTELNKSKQRYATELAQANSNSSNASEGGSKSSSTRPMTIEALELQYQGFKLVETLAENDDQYLREHNDVARAFRWLWRSKGRHLRLQHEESMPPRFHVESKLLAKFLVNYSKAFPSDVDVLFELIRIFLQTTTTDFTFVRNYLAHTVSSVLTVERKKQVMQLFFSLLSGEGSEETKVLTIQLLVLPIFSSALGNGYDQVRGNSLEGKLNVDGVARSRTKSEKSRETTVLDSTMSRKFVKDVLFRDGTPIKCGERLKIELLKLSTVLLENSWEDLSEYRTDLIKFPWSLLKSEHASSKNWAYVNVCQFIVVYETPPKIILQVYVALLRSHQPEGKDLIRSALGVLVPVLPKRLPEDELRKAIDFTNKIMYEEGNSVPQVAHIWLVVVKNPDIFYGHRHRFIRHMTISLHRLGLPPNCPYENRELSLSIIELVLRWEEQQRGAQIQSQSDDHPSKPKSKKRRRESRTAEVDNPSFKKMKNISGDPVASDAAMSATDDDPVDELFTLDDGMIETVLNFLIRLRLLIADSKVDGTHQELGERTTTIFRNMLSRWKTCALNPGYFEKVVSMCVEENTASTKPSEPASEGIEKKTKDKAKGKAVGGKGGSKGGKAASSKAPSSSPHTKNKDEPPRVSTPLLSACIDILGVLISETPRNVFFRDNSSKIKEILGPCIARAGCRDGKSIRKKLKDFLLLLFSRSGGVVLHEDDMIQISALLERSLVDAASPEASSEPTDSSGRRLENSTQDEPRSKHKTGGGIENGVGGACSAWFSVEVIEEVCVSNPEFVERFVGSIVSLTENLARKHAQEASSHQRHLSSSAQQMGSRGVNEMHITPVAGIISEACSADHTHDIVSGNSKASVVNDVEQARKVPPLGTALRSLTKCMRLLSRSSVPLSFSVNRRTFFRILSNLLELSDNVQVLMTATSIVGKWLVTRDSDVPVTSEERASFSRKIGSFDFNGLSDVAGQPVADLVASIVLEMHSKPRTSTVTADTDWLMGRSLVACLLNANPLMRSRLIGVFGMQVQDFSSVSETFTPCDHLDLGDVGDPPKGISGRSPLDVLWQLFHSDFEGLGGRLWTAVFVELLLASAKHSGGVSLTSSARYLHDEAGERAGTWVPQPSRKTEASSAYSPGGEKLCNGYDVFCKKIMEERSSLDSRGKCISAIRVLAHGDFFLCQRLFERLIASAWGKLPDDYIRLEIVPSMESLLARPFHSQFLKRAQVSQAESTLNAGRSRRSVRTNVVKASLRAITELNPTPSLNIELLLTLAESYSSWHEVLHILEMQGSALSTVEDCDSRVTRLKQETQCAIRTCYKQLGETDLCLILAGKSCKMVESDWALSLDRHGLVKEALQAYNGLVDLYEKTDEPSGCNPSDFELNLWEERWVDLQKEMSQWQVVTEYAKSSQNPQLLLETAWKSQNWGPVRRLCASASLVGAIETGDPYIKMSEILLAIAEGKLSDVENLHAQTAQLCLHKWQLLPDISRGSVAHVSLLQFFHRLVELRESGQIMVETSSHSSGRTLPDLKNLLSAWRHRLPNEFERLSVWEDLFLWRSHMFSAITTNFQAVVEPGTLATLHDRPWTAIRMAKTARKQGMREVALLSLNKLTDCAMDVSDAFSKLREQILVYDNPESNLERTGGLNLVNTTNLSFFDTSQKSELFRLKAQFLASLGGRSKANQAYCHAVQICPSYARAWVSWGGLCSSLGYLTEKQHENKAASSNAEVGADAAAAAAKKVAQYLAQSMGCYLEAIQCDAHEWSRIHLPRCLWMLAKDGSSPGVLCQTLEARGATLPSWVWLPWIPQLLTSLCRIEGRGVKAILTGLVKSYPQALYFSLRAFYLERRDVVRSRGSSSNTDQHQGSVVLAEELMSSLRRAHPTLWTSLEAILEELIVRFRPSYEEELLATISALLERAESQMNHPKHPEKDDDGDAVLASVAKTLGRISAKFFNASPSDSNPTKRDERARKTAEFKKKYKHAFESDFSTGDGDVSPQKTHKAGLKDFLYRLKKWKRLLETQVSSTPNSLPLIESSPALALFSSDAPDLWAGSCDPRQSNSPSLERSREPADGNLNQSSTSSAVAATTAAAAAAVAVATAAATEGVGGHYGGGSACIEIPGQYVPNRISAQDSKPSPELHPKLVQFESNIHVIRRNEQLVRRIGMIGSDGKRYRFLLQFAIPYWTRTDERTSQLHYLLDKVLRRGIMSCRSCLSVQPSAVVPIAQRLRMTAEEDSRLSLDDAYREACEKDGSSYDSVVSYFQEEVSRLLEDELSKKQDESTSPQQTDTEKSVKLQVYQDICNNKVDNKMLLKHMHSWMDGPERLFQFRRSFTQQLAVDSLLQHVFCVVERTPPRVVFSVRNARVTSPDFRFAYSNQGFLDGNDIPFRMTPNIRNLIGSNLLEGRFVPSVATVASAVSDNQEELDPALRLLLRDDIVSWYTSKSMAKSDVKTQELEKQLADRITKNVSLVQSRFGECKPRKPTTGSTTLEKEPADHRVTKLLEEATDPNKLCLMTPSYQAWL